MKPIFHPEAEAEFLAQVSYYEVQQRHLGADFLSQVNAAVERILAQPDRYRIALLPDIRQLATKRFPFHVIYRERAEYIQILAIASQRRAPQYWLHRTLQ